jgi:hypothetical protein
MGSSRVGALVAVVAMMGCGRGETQGETQERDGACFELRRGICSEYQDADQVPYWRSFCLEGPFVGVWIESCPTDHRLFSCSWPGTGHVGVWYAGNAQCYSPVDESDCDGGVFTAGPASCEGALAIRRFACDHRSRDRRCTDFALNVRPGLVPALEDACAAMGGTVTSEACPTEGRVATCWYAVGDPFFDPDVLERYYSVRAGDAELCATRRGNWTTAASP